ncbi:MAG: winged helix-turn-helix domain-containing protein [Acidimicrobiia bacterium]
MPRPDSLSLAQARRIALAAQGFAASRPIGRIDRRHLRKVFDRLGVVQIDSVNVLVRSHYLPLFSRLGPYDRSLLDRLAYSDHEVFEYWGHDASLIRADLEPLFRWRMEGDHQWSGMRRLDAEHGELIETLYAEVMARGPASAGDLDAADRKKGPWWGWGDTKRALEHLFHEGRVGAIRRATFERAYCDPELVVPPAVRQRPTPTSRGAMVELLVHAARGHGVGTAKDLADYFRLPITVVRPLLEEMADDGLVERVQVEGWKHPTYLHPEARLPRRVDACALVSPFDSIMWERDRIERLFGFRYRIEIYVPRPKRVFGYYVLPFLLGDRYVGRVDLKADRAGSRLLVQSAFAEAGVDHGEVAERLRDELHTMAVWLGLDDVVVNDRGDLAPTLRACSP